MLLVLVFPPVHFLYSHLVNLTFVPFTYPSFIPQLQLICCSSTSFNSLFFSVLPFPHAPFSLCTFIISFLQRLHKHYILDAYKASEFYTSNWHICSLLQSLSTKYSACMSCEIEITGQRIDLFSEQNISENDCN